MRKVLRQELNFSNEIAEIFELERGVVSLKSQIQDMNTNLAKLENKCKKIYYKHFTQINSHTNKMNI